MEDILYVSGCNTAHGTWSARGASAHGAGWSWAWASVLHPRCELLEVLVLIILSECSKLLGPLLCLVGDGHTAGLSSGLATLGTTLLTRVAMG